MTNERVIRRAQPGEAALLTNITYGSKAYWGYDEVFMAIARPLMAISAEQIRNNCIYILEIGEQAAGYYSLEKPEGEAITLENLFIDPAFIGKGCGEELLRHALEQAKAMGYRIVELVSDPHAEGFYRKMGAMRTGETPGATPGRMLPTMRFELDHFRDHSD
ncbi:MAG: GNAT family N-acetyltransferase [Anaerolineae bacterium]|nr:GNAT family N-acetyltransferase [Anaerolineae bacterium]